MNWIDIAWLCLIANLVIGFMLSTWFISAMGYKTTVPPLHKRLRRMDRESWLMCLALSPVAILSLVFLGVSGLAQFVTKTGAFARD